MEKETALPEKKLVLAECILFKERPRASAGEKVSILFFVFKGNGGRIALALNLYSKNQAIKYVKRLGNQLDAGSIQKILMQITALRNDQLPMDSNLAPETFDGTSAKTMLNIIEEKDMQIRS